VAALLNRLMIQPDSTAPDVGTIRKPGGVFLHNFGVDNTFVGVRAGTFTLAGQHNVGIGTNSLASGTFAAFNTALGAYALEFDTTGGSNTAVGADALRGNKTGHNNTAVGMSALALNTVGGDNTAVGTAALASNPVGSNNVAIGRSTLALATSGDFNVAVGSNALVSSDSGSGNTAVGAGALQVAMGNDNIAVGMDAGSNLAAGSGNIHVGHAGAGDESATIRIGNLQQKTFIAGIRGVTTGANNAVNVVVDGNGQLGTISSSRDGKKDIADMSDTSAALLRLRPVVFHYKADRDPAGPRLQYGLIAEEVAEIDPGLVAYDAQGKPETVMYQYLAPMLLNEYQKQQRTIEAQAREIAELRRAVEALVAGGPLQARAAVR
jgi:hypothetical protein